MISQKKQQIIFFKAQIEAAITKYAIFLNKKYQKKNLVIVSVLNGASFFTVDLIKKLNFDVEVDFIAVSSYEDDRKRKKPYFFKRLKIDVEGREILIIEDIIQTGKTINMIYQFLKEKKAKKINVVTLVEFINFKHQVDFEFDSLLKINRNVWIVGYGIDYNEKYRNLENIVALKLND